MADSKKLDWAGHQSPTASEIDWGGQAFPTEGGDQSGLYPDPGMSLRDWFAGQALSDGAMYIADYMTDAARPEAINEAYVLARSAYLIADAMIAARKEGA